MVLHCYVLFLLPVLALAFFLVQIQHTELAENKTNLSISTHPTKKFILSWGKLAKLVS